MNKETVTLVFEPALEGSCYCNGVFYGRGIELCHGAGKGNIYVTSEYYYRSESGGKEHFPIFESTDGGKSFKHISDIYDTEFNEKKYKAVSCEELTTYKNEYWRMLYQPMLYEMPEDMGILKKGDVLCVGTTVSQNYCAIVIYYSDDSLKEWKYLSTVAEGGKCAMEKASAIWEGFLVYEKGALYCFYSDEREMTGGGQRLVMKKSSDAIMWSEDIKVCDFEEENVRYRPGMPVVTKLDDGRFMLVYEGVNMGSPHPNFYKITQNLEKWDHKDHGTKMPQIFFSGSPFCTRMPDGSVIIGGHGTGKIGINRNSVATDEWEIADTPLERGYSRSLFPMMDGSLLITSGGHWDEKGTRKLECCIQRLEKSPKRQ